jgi:hypothetical protein
VGFVVSYGCETWSLTLKEEHGLKVSENKVLRRISGPKRDEVTGDWRKLPNEELHNLYCSPNIILMLKSRSTSWAGHVAHVREKSFDEGKIPLGRYTPTWEDSI